MRRMWKPKREDEFLVDLFLNLLEHLSHTDKQKLQYILQNWFRGSR